MAFVRSYLIYALQCLIETCQAQNRSHRNGCNLKWVSIFHLATFMLLTPENEMVYARALQNKPSGCLLPLQSVDVPEIYC